MAAWGVIMTTQSDGGGPAPPSSSGAGTARAYKIVEGSGVEGGTKVRDLSEDEVSRIREFIDRTYKVEGDLRREVAQDIKRKIEIGSYQGIRHRRSLPVRGQRTHT